ncbi:MAG: hypothetical protein ACFFB5_13940 [Promethearchaeota archaeon]
MSQDIFWISTSVINLGTIPPLIGVLYEIWKSRRERKQQNQLKILEILINEYKTQYKSFEGEVVYNEILKEFLNLYFNIMDKPLLSKKEKKFRNALSLIFTELLNLGENLNKFEQAITPYIRTLSNLD